MTRNLLQRMERVTCLVKVSEKQASEAVGTYPFEAEMAIVPSPQTQPRPGALLNSEGCCQSLEILETPANL